MTRVDEHHQYEEHVHEEQFYQFELKGYHTFTDINISLIAQISIVLLHNICGQLTHGVPPEYINFVEYAPLYSTEKGKCIITDNTKPVPGLLLNKPYTGKFTW
ncbi:hypothetical protein K502DRAFT_349008 [Neoconidiobolus thromboides FSU 785]|nr:hypothetical protein K502DRAFT_349008 [Neoconidiobolus thromboides FSU 785]